MPVHAVPKPNSSDLQLITNHSAGPFSLNSMIPHNTHATYPLDNLHLLSEVLLSLYTQDLHNPILYKSDVAEAYCLMLMHLAWQVKQAVCIDGELHIDRCGVFGGRKSGNYSITFHSLVCWVACEIKGLLHLQVYSEDFYSLNKADNFTFYPPYKKHLLMNQCHLLCLWDELEIPHKEKKQVSDTPLVIIGIEVDPNHLTFTLPAASRDLLLSEIAKFWCTFEATEVDYLGMIISENQIKMDPAKLEGIKNWPSPTTVKQVRSFLGFGNFYRKFIGHYADITRPLNDLTKKDLMWN